MQRSAPPASAQSTPSDKSYIDQLTCDALRVGGDSETKSFWDRRASTWQTRAASISDHLESYGRPGIEQLAICNGERVLDIGCGAGYCSLELGNRVGRAGYVLGVDIAPEMIAAAEHLFGRRGSNVEFMVADIESANLAQFDAAYARFSVALFADPIAGLGNIREALSPGGRLVCVDWGPRQDNPWMCVPRLAAAEILDIDLPGPTFDGLDAALTRSSEVLRRAGFTQTHAYAVAGTRSISDATASQDISTLFKEGGGLSDIWPTLDERTQRRCIDAVIAALDPYRTTSGWSLPGCAVISSAAAPSES